MVYMAQRCLHNYSDQACVGILKGLAAAMADDSRLLVADQVLPDSPAPSWGPSI
jgi:hypothetical protein